MRSVENDRTQREMLRAAIKATRLEGWKLTPKATDDLLWVLKRAGEQLADLRNDAIHALVSLHIGAEIEAGVALPPRSKREWKLANRAATGMPFSSDGALVARPCSRFRTPLIGPDAQISRIRLSDKDLTPSFACNARPESAVLSRRTG
jgi:hypothetical protein